ncbi:MAG: AAA family ATPase, partial [Clostridia bacterium]|nr:AAA family ATPase [Clostridia bacterium]
MFLTSLELVGFKSFPDRIRVDFERGLTGIVGPNGSGKSNISDAVRWVLGEQSSRMLRGNRMEDVIFGGTEKRNPLGFAEVILTIDNSDRSLRCDSDVVAVSRRYYRSGDSEYCINKKHVRLKDVN